MSKTLIMTGAGALLVAGAAGYYVSPARDSDPMVPPVYTAASPQAAMAQLQDLTLNTFAMQVGEKMQTGIALRDHVTKVSPSELRYDFALFGEKVLVLDVKLAPARNGGTSVDIAPVLADSTFARNKNLHPYDRTAMLAVADLLATEYVASVLEGRRMASGNEMKDQFTAHIGFSKDQWEAFGKRMEAAMSEAYGQKLRMADGGYDEPDYEPWDRNYPYEATNTAADAAAEAAEQARLAADGGSW